ncbi:UPF0356 protein YcjA [Lactococcus hodotermopsidis]|uniref:UPF0356 protein YcjA n=1 Tax=Pseudolactococcus hodotermopsidis TaxID=2709157 RepID=A0A6A0B9L5_9LACT|nr:RNA polymerase epsilon subunit [Lactococcus hodotermopsidis]GFH42140.1 UPF0356 protein YcjA [Lactococcus hodotermopsidis]
MLFKVFYQETKKRSPKRETTHSLFLNLDVPEVTDDNLTDAEKMIVRTRNGVIQARDVMRNNTDYHVEFIDAISDEQAEYEKESASFAITTF